MENNRLARRLFHCKNVLFLWFWGGKLDVADGESRWFHGAVIHLSVGLFFVVFALTSICLFWWHHELFHGIQMHETLMFRLGFGVSGFPKSAKEHRVLIIGHNESGTELLQMWLDKTQPSLPFIRFSVRVIELPKDILCLDRIRDILSKEKHNEHLHILLMFREPVASLARKVREEHSSGGVPTGGFTERIIHQMTRQIQLIRQCDNAYGAEHTPKAITDRFSKCYTYGLCNSEKDDKVVRTATEDYGIVMGMYDCVYQVWVEQVGDIGSVGVVTLEEVLRHASTRAVDFERNMLKEMGIPYLFDGGKLNDFIHKTNAETTYSSKEDLEYLPRKLRQRLYSMYHFHMERAAHLMERDLYIYQTYRTSRGWDKESRLPVASVA